MTAEDKNLRHEFILEKITNYLNKLYTEKEEKYQKLLTKLLNLDIIDFEDEETDCLINNLHLLRGNLDSLRSSIATINNFNLHVVSEKELEEFKISKKGKVI